MQSSDPESRQQERQPSTFSNNIKDNSSNITNPFKKPDTISYQNGDPVSSQPPQSSHHIPPQSQTSPPTYSRGVTQSSPNGDGDSNGKPFRSWSATKNKINEWKGSRKLVLVIVAIALLLDNMLLTTVGEFTWDLNVTFTVVVGFEGFQKMSFSLWDLILSMLQVTC